MRVLICGGGVIGASIAYFLSRRGAKPIVIERTGEEASNGSAAADDEDGDASAPTPESSLDPDAFDA